MNAAGTSWARLGSYAHFTHGAGIRVGSGLDKYGSHNTISRVCWPAVTMSGVLPLYAATRLPIALPVPALVCRLTNVGLPVDCANPSAMASTDASCSPRI